jgi:phage shock protein C
VRVRCTCAALRCTKRPFSGVERGRLGSTKATQARHKVPANRPQKRRGRDSNPRWTERPTTVFETAPFNRSGTPPRTFDHRAAILECMESMRRQGLVRPRQGRIVAGVIVGVANRFGMKPNVARLLFVLSMFLPGPQILAYIVLWILMPSE